MTQELAESVLAGSRRALSRVLSLVENDEIEGREALRLLYPHAGKAHIIGITGPAGAGKSTLVGCLAKEYRGREQSVGIVAVDPTSPVHDGALLGDRIRMQELTLDENVFIRSMAARGTLGGLAATTDDVVTVLDAAGKEMIIVETVGAGQDELEIADTAHTTVVVAIPGTGDDIQAIKAGILEIADILVVNKGDMPAADTVAKQLATFLVHERDSGWKLPVLKTSATMESGVKALVKAVDDHRNYISESGVLAGRQVKRARHQLLAAANRLLVTKMLADIEKDDQLEELVGSVARREIDPHSAADRLFKIILQ